MSTAENFSSLHESFNVKLLVEQHALVRSFVQCLAYARGLGESDISKNSDFWLTTRGVYLCLTVIEWCKVFGADKEEVHWKKTADGAKQDHQRFRGTVFLMMGINDAAWVECRKDMKDLRDKFVTHLDIKIPYTGNVGYLDTALLIAYAYEMWVRELLTFEKNSWTEFISGSDVPTFTTEHEKWNTEALSVASRSA